MTYIERDFIGVFVQRSEPAEILWEFQDNRTFGNGEALVKYRRLYISIATDKGDTRVKLSIKEDVDDFLIIRDLLTAAEIMDLSREVECSLLEEATHVLDHYELILSYLSSPDKTESVRAAARAASAKRLANIQGRRAGQ